MTGRELPLADCWNTIGVKGDRSCDKLKAVRHCHHCSVFERAAQAFLDRPPPDAYPQETAELLADSAAGSAEADKESALLFDLGSQTLAIATTAVMEVTEPRAVRRIPHRTNRVFLGLVNVRGQLELCASLSGLLQIDSSRQTSQTKARMMLTERRGQRWVFSADDVLGVQQLGSQNASQVPATAQRDASFCIRHLFAWQERQVGLLDLDQIFAALQESLR